MLERRMRLFADHGYGIVVRWLEDCWQVIIQDRPRGVEVCRAVGTTASAAVCEVQRKLEAKEGCRWAKQN